MSLNTSESNSSERKRSASPIRKYFNVSPSSTPKTPLATRDDNLNDKNNATLNKTQLQQTRFLDFVKSKKVNNTITSTKKIDASCTKGSSSVTERPRPTLKRSHSAISSLDTANELWLNSPLKSKQKRTETTEVYDRLTPGITDMPSAQLMMNKSDINNSGSESNQIRLAQAIGLDPTKRVLSFKPAAPTSSTPDIRKNAPQIKLNTHAAPQAKRHILLTPEKILDAPYMEDDYYLNVLDWSKNNVVAVGLGKSVYLWNADDGTVHTLNHEFDDKVASVNWAADGTYLAVGTSNGEVQLWDARKNARLRSLKGQDCRIGVLGWDKHVVASGARDGSIFSHDVRMAKSIVKELYGHTDDVCGLKYRWDGDLLATGGNDNTVNVWDSRSTEPIYQKRSHVGAIKALAWCPWNHNLLATGGGRDDKKIHFWNTTTGLRVNTIYAGSQVTSLNWSHHYKEIVSTHGYPHNQVTVWGYPTLNKIIDIPAHDSRILHSVTSPDGQVLATAAADGNLKFWRVFEADGKARLATESSRLTAKKAVDLRKWKSLR